MPDATWESIIQSDFARAIDEYSARIAVEPKRGPHYANRAIAYLGLRDYKAASDDYAAEVRLVPDSDGGYIGQGMCLWCQYRPSDALVVWREGLHASYTDAAGGVELPAVLLYAGLRLADPKVQGEARQMLRKSMHRKHIVNWPGAIVPYLLGKLSDRELWEAVHRPSLPEVLEERHRCQANFYVGVNALARGDESRYRTYMRECAASWYGFLEQEYHLACWEVENQFPPIHVADATETHKVER